MFRTADKIEETKAVSHTENSVGNTPKKRRGNPDKIKPYQWKPGESGNPGGRPKNDLAKRIAIAIFENNEEAIYEAFASALLNGNAYTFKELAERAFGKLNEKVEHTGADGGPIETSVTVTFVKPDAANG